MARRILSFLTAALVSACGGGGYVEPVVVLDGSTVKALSADGAEIPAQDSSVQKLMLFLVLGGQDCLPPDAYQQQIKDHRFLPYPANAPAGSIWSPPFLLVPAAPPEPVEVAPGLVGTPVVVPGPNGPMNIKGLYYVEGETPGWVCRS